jgi:hypothetical protein
MTRAVVYARYSSDNQRDASIEDQVSPRSTLIPLEGGAAAAPSGTDEDLGDNTWRLQELGPVAWDVALG